MASRGSGASSVRAQEPMSEDSRARDSRRGNRSPPRHSSRLSRSGSFDEPARRPETRYWESSDRRPSRERDWRDSLRRESSDRGYQREREHSPRSRRPDYRESEFRRPSLESTSRGRNPPVRSPDTSPSHSRAGGGQYTPSYSEINRRPYPETSARDRDSYLSYPTSMSWRRPSESESKGPGRRQSAASDVNSIHSQDGSGRVVETVTHNGVERVPTGPKIGVVSSPMPTSGIDFSIPHIMILGQSWKAEPAPHMITHLFNMLRAYPPKQIELLTRTGFFLGFEDSPFGRSTLEQCYEHFDGAKLFGEHPLVMERFPAGRVSRESQAFDRRGGQSRGSEITTNGRAMPSDASQALSKQGPHSKDDSAASAVASTMSNPELPPNRSSDFGQDAAQDSRTPIQSPVLQNGQVAEKVASMPPRQAGNNVRQDTDDTASSVSGITGRSDASSSKRPQCHICGKGVPEDRTDLVRCPCGRRYHRRCHIKPNPIPNEVGEDWRCKRCTKNPQKSKREGVDKRRSSLSSELFVREGSDSAKGKEPAARVPRGAKAGKPTSATGGEKSTPDMLQVPQHTPRATRNTTSASPQRSNGRQAASSEEYDPFQENTHGITTDGTSPSTGATPEPPRVRASRSPAHSLTRSKKVASQGLNEAVKPHLKATSNPDVNHVNGSVATSNSRTTNSRDKQIPGTQLAQSSKTSREIPESPLETRNGLVSAPTEPLHLQTQSSKRLNSSRNGDHEEGDGAVIDETTITASQDTDGRLSLDHANSQRSMRSTDPRLRKSPKQKQGRVFEIASNPNPSASPGSNQKPSAVPATLNGHFDHLTLSSDYTTAAELQESAAEQDGRIHRYSEEMALDTSFTSKNGRTPKKVGTPNGRTTRRKKKIIRDDSDEDDDRDARSGARNGTDDQLDENEDLLQPDADDNDGPSDSALSSVAEISEIDPTLDALHRKRRRTAGISQIREAVDEFDLGNWRQRPKGTYVKLICMALHAKPNHTMTPKEAVQWIADNIPDYPTTAGDWTKNIGATLASRRVGSEPMGKKAGLWRREPLEPMNSTDTVWYILLPEVIDIIPQWDPVKQQPYFPVGPETPTKTSKKNIPSLPGSKKVRKRKASESLSPGNRRGSSRHKRKAKSAARVFDSEDDGVDAPQPLDSLPPTSARRNESELIDDEEDTKSPSGYALRRKKRNAASAALQAVAGAGADDENMLDAMDVDAAEPAPKMTSATKPTFAVTLPILTTNDPRLVKRDVNELTLQIRQAASNVECRETSLFDAWPEYDPNRAFDAEAKAAEIKKRPRWKARKGLPSDLDDWMRKPLLPSRPRDKSAHSTRATMQTPRWDDAVGNVTDFKTSEEFFDLPSQPEPFLHEKELAWRDATVKPDGKVRRPIIYKTGYAP